MTVWYVHQTKSQSVCVCVVIYVVPNVRVIILQCHVISRDHNEGDTEINT